MNGASPPSLVVDDLHSAPQPQIHGGSGGAALWLLLSALSFSLMSVCVKVVGTRVPLAEVVLARSLLGVVLSLWLLRRAGVALWGVRRGLLVLRGLIGSAALVCVFGALTQLPLAVATVLQYLYPSLTALLAWPLLGEAVGPKVVLALAIGWLGVLLVSGAGARSLPPSGVLLALSGALLTALAYVSVRDLGRSEHPLVIIFYFPLVAVPLCLPLVLLQPVLPTPLDLVGLLGVGLFTQLGQIGLTEGLTRLPAARATAISYVQVLFAGLWGWWLFGEPIAPGTALGAALILAATLLSLRPARGWAPRG